jgi:hypothetical protein
MPASRRAMPSIETTRSLAEPTRSTVPGRLEERALVLT